MGRSANDAMGPALVFVLIILVVVAPATIWTIQRRRSRARFPVLSDAEFLHKIRPWNSSLSPTELLRARDEIAGYADLPPHAIDPSMQVSELRSVDGWRDEDLEEVIARLQKDGGPAPSVAGDLVARWAAHLRR